MWVGKAVQSPPLCGKNAPSQAQHDCTAGMFDWYRMTSAVCSEVVLIVLVTPQKLPRPARVVEPTRVSIVVQTQFPSRPGLPDLGHDKGLAVPRAATRAVLPSTLFDGCWLDESNNHT